MAHTFVSSRVDYCNSIFLSLSQGRPPRSKKQCAFALAGLLLCNCLSVKICAQILSGSLSSTPHILKPFHFLGAYHTGGRLWLDFTASVAIYKYVFIRNNPIGSSGTTQLVHQKQCSRFICFRSRNRILAKSVYCNYFYRSIRKLYFLQILNSKETLCLCQYNECV